MLDRYILAKTRAMVTELEQLLDTYQVAGACQLLREHLEVLTNWYIRRSRSRFWAGDADALDTLWTVLETVCRAAAPLLPLTTEAIWRGLTGEPSVHLAAWPDVVGLAGRTPDLAAAMDLVRAVCSTALGLRKARQLRVRLPLASLVIAHPEATSLAPFTDLIADEVNVKTVELSAGGGQPGHVRAGRQPAGARAPARRPGAGGHPGGQGGRVVAVRGRVTAAGIELDPGEYELRLAAADAGSTSALPGNAGLIALDTRVTPELAAEGAARDVVRVVQQARRDAGLSVSDRIRLAIGADGAVADAVRAHAGFVAAETLAVSLDVRPAGEVDAEPQPAGDGLVKVVLTKETAAA